MVMVVVVAVDWVRGVAVVEVAPTEAAMAAKMGVAASEAIAGGSWAMTAVEAGGRVTKVAVVPLAESTGGCCWVDV